MDDEPRITESFEEAFALEKSFEVVCAQDGIRALELIHKVPLDLVILDWRLRSEIDGRDVLLHLKNEHPEMLVYVVTASVQEVEEIKALGADRCLLKPCPNLVEMIKELPVN